VKFHLISKASTGESLAKQKILKTQEFVMNIIFSIQKPPRRLWSEAEQEGGMSLGYPHPTSCL
jgi:hypothetical protein